MTKAEWLEIGIEKGIVDLEEHEEVTFYNAYRVWFKMKMQFNKAQSMDRIEVTYNRYYYSSDLNEKCISKITDSDIITFVMRCCLSSPITYKELGRIMPIIKGVLTYMRDIGKGGVPLHDWEKIKRNIPIDKIESVEQKKHTIPKEDVEKLIQKVVVEKIYPLKQSASLCLCLNFYLGLRIGELAALTFDDFDLEKGVVKIRKTESKYYNRDEDGEKIGTMIYRVVDSTKTVYSVREIPLLPEARYIYEKIKTYHQIKHFNSAYLAFDGGQTVLSRSLERTLRKLIQLCDIGKFSAHDIRRSFATIMHYNGVPTRAIADLMGHSEIGTTENCYIKSYEESYDEYVRYMRMGINYKIEGDL